MPSRALSAESLTGAAFLNLAVRSRSEPRESIPLDTGANLPARPITAAEFERNDTDRLRPRRRSPTQGRGPTRACRPLDGSTTPVLSDQVRSRFRYQRQRTRRSSGQRQLEHVNRGRPVSLIRDIALAEHAGPDMPRDLSGRPFQTRLFIQRLAPCDGTRPRRACGQQRGNDGQRCNARQQSHRDFLAAILRQIITARTAGRSCPEYAGSCSA